MRSSTRSYTFTSVYCSVFSFFLFVLYNHVVLWLIPFLLLSSCFENTSVAAAAVGRAQLITFEISRLSVKRSAYDATEMADVSMQISPMDEEWEEYFKLRPEGAVGDWEQSAGGKGVEFMRVSLHILGIERDVIIGFF